MVPEAGDGRWCQAQRCSAIFSVLSCRSLRDLYFNLYDMNETRITMQKKKKTMRGGTKYNTPMDHPRYYGHFSQKKRIMIIPRIVYVPCQKKKESCMCQTNCEKSKNKNRI